MLLIYHQRAFIRRAARELGISTYFANSRRSFLRSNRTDPYINWGIGPKGLAAVPHADRPVLNTDISGASRKLITFERLRAADLPFPRTVTDPRLDGFYEKGRYLGRLDGLSGGEGITVYERGQLPPDDVKHDFFSRVVAKHTEVRIHVWSGDILCEQIKFIPAGSGMLIRNHTNGASFSTRPIDTQLPSDVANAGREIAIRSVAACGLDFAAVDMAFTQRGRWVIFELNSAPGVSVLEEGGGTYPRYLDRIRSLIG